MAVSDARTSRGKKSRNIQKPIPLLNLRNSRTKRSQNEHDVVICLESSSPLFISIPGLSVRREHESEIGSVTFSFSQLPHLRRRSAGFETRAKSMFARLTSLESRRRSTWVCGRQNSGRDVRASVYTAYTPLEREAPKENISLPPEATERPDKQQQCNPKQPRHLVSGSSQHGRRRGKKMSFMLSCFGPFGFCPSRLLEVLQFGRPFLENGGSQNGASFSM